MTEKEVNKTVGVVMASLLPQNEKRELIDSIRAMEKETKNNGWIPCSERLPSFDERRKSYCRNVYGSGFIVMIKGATIPTTLYIKMEEDVWFDDNYNYYNVIAWQPLPEPYEEETEDE